MTICYTSGKFVDLLKVEVESGGRKFKASSRLNLELSLKIHVDKQHTLAQTRNQLTQVTHESIL